MVATQQTASAFKALHQRPKHPIILVNVYDGISARAVAELPECEALATASYAVALAAGTTDDDLDLEANVAAAKAIGKVASELKKPFTVDLQDGYGDRLDEAIRLVLDVGAVGINIEDTIRGTKELRSVDDAVGRIQRVLAVAKEHSVPDFTVNARCDVLMNGGTLEETIARGKRYLDAGAATVFVLGGHGRGGVTRIEVERLAKAFAGRLNVSVNITSAGLSVAELSDIGIARLSVGPQLGFKAAEAMSHEARKLLSQ